MNENITKTISSKKDFDNTKTKTKLLGAFESYDVTGTHVDTYIIYWNTRYTYQTYWNVKSIDNKKKS